MAKQLAAPNYLVYNINNVKNEIVYQKYKIDNRSHPSNNRYALLATPEFYVDSLITPPPANTVTLVLLSEISASAKLIYLFVYKCITLVYSSYKFNSQITN